jgi:hypothetical protein
MRNSLSDTETSRSVHARMFGRRRLLIPACYVTALLVDALKRLKVCGPSSGQPRRA